MISYCGFHISHAHDGTHHFIFPYCGCGWTGEMGLLEEITPADLTALAFRWERHRVQFLSKQRTMRSVMP